MITSEDKMKAKVLFEHLANLHHVARVKAIVWCVLACVFYVVCGVFIAVDSPIALCVSLAVAVGCTLMHILKEIGIKEYLGFGCALNVAIMESAAKLLEVLDEV